MGNPFANPFPVPAGSGLPAPSGTKTVFSIGRPISPIDFQKASEALDRALLRKVGLPEEVEIREFENEINEIAGEIKTIVKDFTLSKLIALLPTLIMDAAALYDKLNPVLKNQVSRIDFVSRVIRYAYKKNDPDLPYLVEPFETMIEDMILNAVPGLLLNLETKLSELFQNLTKIVK